MNAFTHELIEPVSLDDPCGEDISDSGEIYALEVLLQGKEETQFEAGEEPDWREVLSQCEAILKRSKHLQVVVTYSVALLKTKGLAGFREGLQLTGNMLSRYWEPIFPRLDPDDGNDPTERCNLLGALSAPVGQLGDPFKVIKRLRDFPLSNSRQLGSHSFHMWSSARNAGEGEFGQIDASFKDTPEDHLRSIINEIRAIAEAVRFIEATFAGEAGASASPNLDGLTKLLGEMEACVGTYLSTEGETTTQETALVESTSVGGAVPDPRPRAVLSAPGSISSRADVRQCLEMICQYYQREEPASPVPWLLKRALRLLEKDFLEIIEDFTPDSLDKVREIVGRQQEEE